MVAREPAYRLLPNAVSGRPDEVVDRVVDAVLRAKHELQALSGDMGVHAPVGSERLSGIADRLASAAAGAGGRRCAPEG